MNLTPNRQAPPLAGPAVRWRCDAGALPASAAAARRRRPGRCSTACRPRHRARVHLARLLRHHLRNPRTQQLVGIDIDLSAELGRDLGVKLQYVDSSFATLIDDLRPTAATSPCSPSACCRSAWSSCASRALPAERHLRRHHAQQPRRARWADIDKPGVAVAVQAGTFMEPVMAAALKQASWSASSRRHARARARGRPRRRLHDRLPLQPAPAGQRRLGPLISPPQPFHVLPYAYAVKPGDDEWLAQVDQFVAASSATAGSRPRRAATACANHQEQTLGGLAASALLAARRPAAGRPPPSCRRAGAEAAAAAGLHAVPAGPSSTAATSARHRGREQLVAFRASRTRPLVVLVEKPLDVVLADWAGQRGCAR
jgi:cyclohexadienyl dehydratase